MRRQWVWIVLVLLLTVVLVNDVSRLAATHFALDSMAVTAGDAAADAVRMAQDRDNAFLGYQAAAWTMASDEATITTYTQQDGRIFIRVEGPVESAIILAPIVSLWSGGTWIDPMTVTKEYERPI